MPRIHKTYIVFGGVHVVKCAHPPQMSWLGMVSCSNVPVLASVAAAAGLPRSMVQRPVFTPHARTMWDPPQLKSYLSQFWLVCVFARVCVWVFGGDRFQF